MRNIYLKTKTLEEAIFALDEHLDQFYKNTEVETIPVREALDRVSSKAIYARLSSPLYHSCAMDGIMVESKKTVSAREHEPLHLDKSEFKYCDTGDPLEKPYDAVIMIEDISEDEDGVTILAPIHPWEHVRPVGEDIIENDLLFVQNHRFSPIDLSVLLAAGIKEVEVLKKPTVAIIPTGDEIVSGEEEIKIGDIIESNTAMFAAMAEQRGAVAVVYPVIPDIKDKLKDTVAEAIAKHDIVTMVAGSSAGRDDYTKQIAEELGNVYVHGISIKPGKPAVLAVIGDKPFIGLPGYPVSGHIVFDEIVLPIIAKKLRRIELEKEVLSGVLTRPVISSLKNREYIRIKMGKIDDKVTFTPLDRGAGSSYSLSQSDGYLIVPRNSEGYLRGDDVEVRLHKPIPKEVLEKRLVSIGSHDMVLDVINDEFAKAGKKTMLLSSHVGSFAGLQALAAGNCHLAPSHLLGKGGKYNDEGINLFFKDQDMAVIKVVGRRQGVFVPKGNPQGIKGIKDLVGKSMVNRQRGAGTRVLFDYMLENEGISVNDIPGYEHEVTTHLAAALAVKNGDADFSIGVESAAINMGVDFIYLADEDYEFVLKKKDLELDAIQELIELLKSDEFRQTVDDIGGYSTEDSGVVRYVKG